MERELEAEALSLLSRVHADDAPLGAMLALEAWEARSDDHRAAMARVTRAWHAVGAIDADMRAAAPLPPAGPRRPVRPIARRRMHPLSLGLGAAAAAMAAGAAFLLIPAAPPLATVIATARGQTRLVQLADGSRILLGAGSRMSVRMDGDQRAVRLLAGQARFTIHHDASRPFAVVAGNLTIRDIGTVFAVTRRADAIVVSVAEGVVEAAASGIAPARLVAGQQLRLDAAGRGAITRVDPDMAMAWTTGQLRYDRAPLSDVVADINRYAATPLHLADGATARLSYSGTVRADAIDEWVSALPYAFPVVVRQQRDTVEIAPRRARGAAR